jgi:hypothetical protein
MTVARGIYLFGGGLACAALGSAAGMRPIVGIAWAVFLLCMVRLINDGVLGNGGSGRARRPVTLVPPLAADSETIPAEPSRRIFFDSDLPASFFTGESERAREIAAGADWTKGLASDDESASDSDLSALRFVMPRLYAAAMRARESGPSRTRRRSGLQPPQPQPRRGNTTDGTTTVARDEGTHRSADQREADQEGGANHRARNSR